MPLLLLALSLLPAPAWASGVALQYEVRYGPLRVLAVQTTARFDAGRYEATSQMQTVGLAGVLFPGRRGRAPAARAPPTACDRRSTDPTATIAAHGARSRSTMTTPAWCVAAAVEPPPEADDREPVSEAERVATIDPLTATLTTLQQGCRGTLRIFDGRRRYDLELTDLGESALPETTPAYAGVARHCRAGVTPRAGFWRATDRQDERPAQLDVWIAAPRPELEPVPVYMQLSGPRGALDFQLSAATALPEPSRAGRRRGAAGRAAPAGLPQGCDPGMPQADGGGMGHRRTGALVAVGALIGLLPPPPRAAAHPLARHVDPVVVTGADLLAALPAATTAPLRLYRWRDGAPVPVPYQFDARDKNGDVELAREEFALDANDELVFMAGDTGERAAAEALPPGCTGALEIAVRDPVGGGRGWVYLLQFDDPPPRAADPPYATLDADGRRARSANYDVEYAEGANVFNVLRVSLAAGGSGENLLRQTRMVGEPTLRLLFTDLTFRFDERSTVARIDGVRNGPVRAIRQVRLSIDLGRYFPDLPNGTTHTYHYADGFDSPARVSIPWLVLRTLRSFRFEDVVVFDPAVLPLRYWDGANLGGVDLGPDVQLRTDVDHDWWAVRGRAGSILETLHIPESWRRWGIARGTVAGSGREPDDGAGDHVAGYSLLNMTQLRDAGDYELRQLMLVMRGGYEPGDEAAARAMAEQPLRTTVTRLR
ncbi:MAG: DUF3108 domain-containing protein [Candidatus Binatia bacterium]